MKQQLTKAFQKAEYKPKEDLVENIWHTIMLREKRAARLKLWVFSSLGFASLAGLVPAFKILMSAFAQSGFYEYLSLIFKSGGFLSSWKEFSLLLIESLPAISIVLLLALVFIFLLSLRFAMRQIIRGQFKLSF